MTNIFKQNFTISKEERENCNGHKALVIWFTGLSGSGKSTLANALEQALFNEGINTYVLDGDNTRLGINKDLDFSEAGRKENIRRIAEISKLMSEAGLVTITSFISPFSSDRDKAKQIIGKDNMLEIYVKCSLEACEKRDVKGLYKKAREGAIPHFTGISSPYEEPLYPDLTVDTSQESIEVCLSTILGYVKNKIKP